MTKSQSQRAEDVVVLNVSSMNMEDIDPTDFEKFRNLVEIDCSENPRLPFQKLASLKALKMISFCGNNLANIRLENGFIGLEVNLQGVVQSF